MLQQGAEYDFAPLKKERERERSDAMNGVHSL